MWTSRYEASTRLRWTNVLPYSSQTAIGTNRQNVFELHVSEMQWKSFFFFIEKKWYPNRCGHFCKYGTHQTALHIPACTFLISLIQIQWWQSVTIYLCLSFFFIAFVFFLWSTELKVWFIVSPSFYYNYSHHKKQFVK